MCGITGLAVRPGNGLELAPKKKLLALDSVRHRGPDMQGQYADGQVWLGHVRLSILDLSNAASQQMIFVPIRILKWC